MGSGVNAEVARMLDTIAELLLVIGDNPFKIRAYQRAAETVRRTVQPVAGMSRGELVAVDGIGKAIAEAILSIAETGTCNELESLKEKIPPGLPELLELDTVGPKTVQKLWSHLNITSLTELEAAARGRRIRSLRGFGEKKEEDILRAITVYKNRSGRMLISEAEEIAEAITAHLTPGTYAIAGSLRRGRSTVGDIDIVTTEPAGAVNPHLRAIANEMIDEGTKKTSIFYRGKRVDIRFADPSEFGATLLYLTGSKEFNIRLRERAIASGMQLNEYGLLNKRTKEMIRCATEDEVFTLLGLAFIPPELREDRGEVRRAEAKTLPRLLEPSEIKGDLHAHTKGSDGVLTVAELAEMGDRLGYEYILCSDHSASLGVARGLSPEAVREQAHLIEMANRDHTCQILAGIEVDIMTDGSLGLPDEVLEGLDCVIASVHSSLHQDADTITRRVIRAMESEHVDIIGHPTGRLLGRREPSVIDIPRIIEAARETGTALELNASPHRLDLDDIYLKTANESGVQIAIGTDAHGPEDFASMRYGVITARRGWCRAGDILNTKTLQELLDFFR
ncbi:MAG: DNA polymerase/3'-5' exonuclease PolX [Methanocalculus sp.]|uniref:DNA polymerase/3'-5' exonuclease PolX n=1 Tax=Methanocalculus sp. TaxID=2004547 RepID=UPI002722877C|nr:DNA polymerase/3'-5' exonuclease PolX [Methanocalculus sp.]MDO9539998.1 DNA polymerase/3'-5' exonuclease PolX [Methanocalculus sp.]